jgi:hypothetical protein
MPTMELFFYGFTLWLGAYLLARRSRKATVQLTGWGLIAYAFALAIQILFDQFILVILLALTLLWIGAAPISCWKKIKPSNAHSHLRRAWHGAIIMIEIFHFSFK